MKERPDLNLFARTSQEMDPKEEVKKLEGQRTSFEPRARTYQSQALLLHAFNLLLWILSDAVVLQFFPLP